MRGLISGPSPPLPVFTGCLCDRLSNLARIVPTSRSQSVYLPIGRNAWLPARDRVDIICGTFQQESVNNKVANK